ncbi:hypothetical protein EV06_1367 [Prochlorococcus sp. MIT 0602]|nr:hypothetical protein EV06_1367 [Prochlorococcus sp. MIT 0602]KGG17775.1 hypothetical protein EV07_1215 [Prochlorococcus sp. MIT 0603]
MTAEEIQTVGNLLSSHPPIVIATLCIFMYIRGKALEKQRNSIKNPLT